jgi:FdhD protein
MNEETSISNSKADRPGATSVPIRRVDCSAHNGTSQATHDQLAIEEPLEIRLEYGPHSTRATQAGRIKRSISITMRTPGYDFELAAGFLFTEGIVRRAEDIEKMGYCGVQDGAVSNVVRVELAPEVQVDMDRLSRHFYTSSSCGVCGKSSIEALKIQSPFPEADLDTRFPARRIQELPEILRKSQVLFDTTGGLHASALFSQQGDPLIVREDVGRHNALDKLVGHALLGGLLPLKGYALLVSGRASFELIQKAAMAGVSVFAAVGAPSSLAVELANQSTMTLLGFVKSDRFNIYSHGFRIRLEGEV